jgi:ABC-type antimicrobial peptide transport system permease subunit
MNRKGRLVTLLIPLAISMTSCRQWFEFDMKRYTFSFIISLLIGLIGLIIISLKGSNKK